MDGKKPTPPPPLHAADAWAAGVTMLEVLAGLPDPLAPSSRGAASLRARLANSGVGVGGGTGGLPTGDAAADTDAALFLTGLMEVCVFESPAAAAPSSPSSSGAASAVPWACTDGAVAAHLAARAAAEGPPGEGGGPLPTIPLLGLRLARKLLSWHPSSRPTAEEALRHAYFTREAGGGCSGADRRVDGLC